MKSHHPKIATLVFVFLATLAPAMVAAAADIKVCAARLGVTVLGQLAPEFEKETGQHLNVTEIYGPEFMKRVRAGNALDADVVILRFDLIDSLIKEGKLRAETRTNLVKTGLGVEVRMGAHKPDISSVEAFKQALLNAKSVAYLANGLETPYLDGLLQRLGIADDVQAKLTQPGRDVVSILTAKGAVELGIAIIAQIVTTEGVEFVGPLPPEYRRISALRAR